MSQRRFERAPFQGSVALCRQRSAQVVRPRDIGGGGIRVNPSQPLAPRTLVTLHITLPGEPRGFTVMGRVVRALGDDVAVEFLGMLPSQRSRVDAWVRANNTQVQQTRAG